MAPLGNLVRLLPLHVNELPAHAAFESLLEPHKPGATETNKCPNLISFVLEVLEQATVFVEDTLPNTFKEGSTKTSSPSKAQVKLSSREVDAAEIQSIPWMDSNIPRNWSASMKKPPEAWFARRSRHANQREEGTAQLDEFDYGLRHDHSKHEQDYTPDVFDSYKVLDWDDQIQEAVTSGSSVDKYGDISMSIFEMCHKLPAMLSNRVFSVVVVTAKIGKDSFIVVQMPVDISNLQAAFYCNGRNMKEGDSALKRKKPVLGFVHAKKIRVEERKADVFLSVYTSIERCRLLPEQEVDWLMATASDAKGSLPMSMQKLGIPSAIVGDVGMFMAWIKERRK